MAIGHATKWLSGEMEGSVCAVKIHADGSKLAIAVLQGSYVHCVYAVWSYPLVVSTKVERTVETVFDRGGAGVNIERCAGPL